MPGRGLSTGTAARARDVGTGIDRFYMRTFAQSGIHNIPTLVKLGPRNCGNGCADVPSCKYLNVPPVVDILAYACPSFQISSERPTQQLSTGLLSRVLGTLQGMQSVQAVRHLEPRIDFDLPCLTTQMGLCRKMKRSCLKTRVRPLPICF